MPPPAQGSLPYVTGPAVHSSTMPSEAPTATTVHPRVEVVAAPARGRSRTAMWAGVAAVTGLAIGLAAPSLLGRAGDVSPAAGDRVGTTILDTEDAGGLGEVNDGATMTEMAALEAAALDAEEDAEAAEREAAEASSMPDERDAPAGAAASLRAEPGNDTTASTRPASPAPQGVRIDDPYASPTATAPAAPAASAPSADANGDRAFDRVAAASALGGAVSSASACRGPDDPSGVAQVTVTFAPSGRVTQATVDGPPYAGTATGGCIARAFGAVTVPAFGTDAVTVTRSVRIP